MGIGGGTGLISGRLWMRELVLENEPTCVAVARRFVASYLDSLDVPRTEAGDVLLAFNEAVSNAHRHAAPGAAGRVRVACDLKQNQLVLVIEDNGEGFDYDDSMSGSPDPLAASGRGLFLMNELMDRVDVDSSPDGTRVELVRQLRGLDRKQALTR